MTGSNETDEVLSIVQCIGPVVMSSAVITAGIVGASLRRAVGMMVADKNMVDNKVFSFALSLCLDLARHCGATLVTMDRVRKAAMQETPVSLAATQTILAIVRLTLACEARIIAYMIFRSRDEVDDIAKQVHLAFNETAETAADDLDVATYAAIVSLHGAVTMHLADSGRKLPRVIDYKFQIVMPALRMAQRSYEDPTRYLELIAENNIVHPAFCPMEGKMLAV
jgi:prophage DNA circulation protein